MGAGTSLVTWCNGSASDELYSSEDLAHFRATNNEPPQLKYSQHSNLWGKSNYVHFRLNQKSNKCSPNIKSVAVKRSHIHETSYQITHYRPPYNIEKSHGSKLESSCDINAIELFLFSSTDSHILNASSNNLFPPCSFELSYFNCAESSPKKS